MEISKNRWGGQRDSNLELYRILVMLLIVSHHYVVNSGVLEKMYENPLSANSIFLFLFGAWGKTGINCFMMITGYFMCKSRIMLEKYAKLIFEVLFYNIILSIIFFCTGYGSWMDIINALLIIKNVDSANFIACFLVFYLLIPFINILLNNINKKQHQYLLALLSFLYIFLGTVPKFSVTMNYISWFSFIYLVAAYIRFYSLTQRRWGFYTVLFTLLGCLSIIVCLVLGAKLDKEVAYKFVSDSNTFLAFAIALCSFLFFKNLHLKYSSVINAIGGSTFGVLCIHANSGTMRNWLWKTVFNVSGHYILPTMKLIVYSFGCVFLVFVSCTIIDIVRKKIMEKKIMCLLETSLLLKIRKGFDRK